jgi:methylmalonyl-CoA/ethylmalonyl-CoA epimerase
MRITQINHLAIAVDDLERALGFWRDGLGLEVTHEAREEGQGVEVAFLPVGEAAVELVRPLDGNSGVAKFIERRGGGIHHMCLEVDDLDAALTRLREHGVRLTSEEPYINTAGRRLIFVHPASSGGVLVELYEALPQGASADDGHGAGRSSTA